MRINVSTFPLPKFSTVLLIANTSAVKDIFSCLLATYQNHLESFKRIEIPTVNHTLLNPSLWDRAEESVTVKGYQVIPMGSLV